MQPTRRSFPRFDARPRSLSRPWTFQPPPSGIFPTFFTSTWIMCPGSRATILPGRRCTRPGVLGTALHLQRNLDPIVPLGIDLVDLAPDRDAVAALADGSGVGGAGVGGADRTAEELPVFRYHPDPVATGAITRTVLTCAVCRRARGWRLAGVDLELDLDLDLATGDSSPTSGINSPASDGRSPRGVLCPWRSRRLPLPLRPLRRGPRVRRRVLTRATPASERRPPVVPIA